MYQPGDATRRRFMSGLAAAFGISKLSPFGFAFQRVRQIQEVVDGVRVDVQAEYDTMVKLSSNENPYGPSEAVMKAMTGAWKYANRYGYPEGGITEAIAAYHNVTPDLVLLGSGSAEVLKAADDAFLPSHLKVVGVEPTFEVVYRFATNSKAEAVTVPLREDHTVDMKEIIRVTRLNARDVGLVYICNPNNPTGNVVHKDDIKLLLDSVPEDIPVLIDEAYHHFVDSPDYESSLKYVLEGRKVIVTRTFSKIAALAGMRLGYGIAPREVIDQMRRVSYGSINAVVKYGGVAALQDTSYEAKIKQLNKQARDWTTAQMKSLGYETIPSETNFFMVNVKRDVTPVREEFRMKGILVGRKFPPMDTWLRVSVGSEEDMRLFVAAFKEILSA
jgi:histidinol-phosphate aminotransferase